MLRSLALHLWLLMLPCCMAAYAPATDGEVRGSRLASPQETMGSRYDVAETALERASAELKAANLRTLALEVASRQEREALVKAAVGSLQQLRTHLVDTLSGLREDPNRWPDQEHPKHRPKKSTEAGLDGFSWNPNKHRWGVSTAGGAFDEMVMRLEMPDIPPSSPSLSPELP